MKRSARLIGVLLCAVTMCKSFMLQWSHGICSVAQTGAGTRRCGRRQGMVPNEVAIEEKEEGGDIRVFEEEDDEEDYEDASDASSEQGGVGAAAKAEYLARLAAHPTLYKRAEGAASFPSIGYDGAFQVSPQELRDCYSPYARIGEAGSSVGKGGLSDGSDILMRVMVVGGSEREAKFLKELHKKGDGSLVSGLYVTISTRNEETLHESMNEIPMVNVHELGRKDFKDPKKLVEHAAFLRAQMLVLLDRTSEAGEFAATVKALANNAGVTYVGADVGELVSEGDMSSFVKLVEDTRLYLAKTVL